MRALLRATKHARLCREHVSCKIPHKKAFFAVLTDDAHAAGCSRANERAMIARTCPGRA